MARENGSHAPGGEISGGAMKQHQTMAEGHGVMAGGNFGVEPMLGARPMRHPDRDSGVHGKHLADHERAGPPNFEHTKGAMAATHHSSHGPHHHGKEHDVAPKGMRPHHIGGSKR